MEWKRQAPNELELYDVLLRRVEGDTRDLRARFAQLQTGYAGERRVDREWKEVGIQGLLFHDFTCRNALGHTHQIDTLFVCKHFVLVVEVKNISGRIDFDDERRQFLRTHEDGRVESFMNPIDQVKRHRDFLRNESLHWTEHVPIEACVVIANPSTVIGRVSNEVPVFNVSGLRSKVADFARRHAAVNINPRIVKGYLERLYEPIVRVPRDLPYTYRRGVLCLNCHTVMQHTFKGFVCHKCGIRDAMDAALLQAMHDYRVLYGAEISNSEFRAFCGVENWRTANAMLKRLFKNYEGQTKARKYIIPKDIRKLKK